MSEALDYKALKEELDRQNSKVAGWLLYHLDRKKQLQEEKEEIRQGAVKAVQYSHEPKTQTNQTGDQVLSLVIKLDSIKLEKEIKLIEDVLKILPLEKKIFLQLRQKYNNSRGGRHRYNAYVRIQHEYVEKMSELTRMSEEEVWREERTFKLWWKEIIEITVRLALKRGLL